MGSVLSYVFYWLAVIVTLIYLKFKEVSLIYLSRNTLTKNFVNTGTYDLIWI